MPEMTSEDLLEARRVCAQRALLPLYEDAKRALSEEGVEAVVWQDDQIRRLDFKPVLPSQFGRVFGVEGENFETRLLQMGPSCYVLGAGDASLSTWAHLPDHVRATQHFQMGPVKKAVVMYYE